MLIGILCAAVFFCGFFATKNTQNAEALTSFGTIDSATKIGNGDTAWDSKDDLWDNTNQCFSTVFYKLKKELFGSVTTDAAAYIKNTANGAVTDTGSMLITASTLNAKAGSDYGYVVKLGGLDWMITSLTVATVDGKEVPIMTLYLADGLTKSDGSALESLFYSTGNNTRGENMYSRSILRSNIKSESGDYAKLALFNKTDASKNADSEAQFLVQPKNIPYQLNQTQATGRTDPFAANYHMPNDALIAPSSGWWPDRVYANSDRYPDSNGVQQSYDAWGNDYIWVPSATETGWTNYLMTSCIWQLSDEQRAHTATSWLRSGFHNTYFRACSITSAGSYDNFPVASNYGVRPALHLNLDAVEQNAPIPAPEAEKEASKKGEGYKTTYDGKEQTLAKESWYLSEVFDNTSCVVTYTDSDGIAATPQEAGEYTATIILSGDYVWMDATSATDNTRTVKFTIEPKKLKVNFAVDSTAKVPKISLVGNPIDGDTVNCVIRYFDMSGNDLGTDSSVLKAKTQYKARAEFDNPNYEPDNAVELTFTNPSARVKASFMDASCEYNGLPQFFDLIYEGGETGKTVATAALKGTYDSTVDKIGDRQFTALNAGKYKVTLTLTNKDGYVWDSTGKTDDIDLEFEITPKTVKVYISSFTPSNWAITQRYKAKANLELPSLEEDDTLTVILSAFYNGNAIRNLCAIGLDSNTDIKEFELATDTLSPNTYPLGITYDDPNDVNAKNYNVILDKDYSFTIKQPSASGGLIWRLMQGSTLVGSQSDPADIDTATFDKKITYNGKSFVFVVNADGLEYSVDTSYNSNGFVNGYKTVAKGKTAALTTVTNAGDYITTVHLKKGTETAEYHIEWTIDKVKSDLSKVRWLDNGQVSYNEKGMTVELDPETLPEGLTPVVNSVTPATVGQSSTAKVTFTVDDPTNYEVPVSTDKDTYTFKANGGLTDFEWEKTWMVVPTVIPVKWMVGMITVNGKKVSVEALAGEYDSYLKYVYYETDESGAVPSDATPLDEPVIEEGVVKYYVAEVSIKSNFDGKYVLEAGKSNRSPVFEAGKNITVVQLAAKKRAYPYTGQPVDFQFEVTQGTIVDSAFEIVYYKGTLKQANPPKDVGSYRAQIKLKSDYERDYYIDGDYAFDFTIDKAVITIDWDNATIPTSLKLKSDEKAVITYEYSDSDGNTVGFATLRTTPGTYNVRAVIKNAYQKNYIFDNDEVETEWKSFEITEEDIKNGLAIDPNDPDGNKQYVEFSLASTSGAKGTAPQVKNEVGLILGTDYSVKYFKDGEPASDFSIAGKYEIKITLLGDKADNYILISNTLEYTIIEGEGEGSGTTMPNGEGEGGNNGGTPSDWTIESILPIILSGISLVLIVVFTVMTLNNASAAKEARAKTKKLAVISYSVSPASLLMLFGLSYTNWWIVAGVLMGFALIMAIVAFMMKNKKKKAFVALEEEQNRIAEEKEYARREEMREEQARIREEQERRDNEMRMMFSSMQQSYQQPQVQQQLIDYDMLQNMIASSVSALLPSIQQLQALPPALPDSNTYVMPNPEAEALRAQLAAQEERMAQQQELLNQILQNQQNYVMPLYEEEPEDDISWLGDSEELISLEESYGALSDEGKRAYYEIGSYIMNKPRTSQNDGRYAVLFKYCGKTIFKLAIKDDAPVLYYPAGKGGRSEVRVSDIFSLELAKSMIDRIVMKVDNELN